MPCQNRSLVRSVRQMPWNQRVGCLPQFLTYIETWHFVFINSPERYNSDINHTLIGQLIYPSIHLSYVYQSIYLFYITLKSCNKVALILSFFLSFSSLSFYLSFSHILSPSLFIKILSKKFYISKYSPPLALHGHAPSLNKSISVSEGVRLYAK